MTRLFNDSDDFAKEMIEGFALAAARWVRPVAGGVVRATRGAEPTVAVVVGGGSGHYPAFGGLVGPGLAHGAAMGDIFASPSAQRVTSVATSAHEGRGVLLSFGNYAGDVLNFGRAQDQLRQSGIDCRTVVVTDDVCSAPKDRLESRRGIAGDLTVFKVAGAAAEAGYDLDEVERVARKANSRTRSFGVAFSGCTLPGADEPLFDVPPGRMAVGLGIHGEPGIDEVDLPTADGLARIFVERLLDEIPDGVGTDGGRVVPILNGLGSVKHEELFVVYRSVHRLLEAAGITVVDPEVGEFCTSFDMAGASLTLLWLDDELDRLWAAPADTAAFRRGAVADRIPVIDTEIADVAGKFDVGTSSAASRVAARVVAKVMTDVAHMLDGQAEELGRLDRIAGDGDHGIGMQRGSRAAAEAATEATAAGAGARITLQRAGSAWADMGGGTSGAIWGEMLTALAPALDGEAITAQNVGTGVALMKDAVMSFGKAKPGDKTMIDAIVPFADDLADRLSAGTPLVDAWAHAADVATAAAEATADITARLGRARTHGTKSLGTPDPGAVSFALIAHVVLNGLKESY